MRRWQLFLWILQRVVIYRYGSDSMFWHLQGNLQCYIWIPITCEVYVDLSDWRQLVKLLWECPEHTFEVVRLHSTCFEASHASGAGISVILLRTNGTPWFWSWFIPTKISTRIFYWDHTEGNWNINDLELAEHHRQLSLVAQCAQPLI